MQVSIHDIKLQSTSENTKHLRLPLCPTAKTMPNSNTPCLFLLLSTATLLFVAYALGESPSKLTSSSTSTTTSAVTKPLPSRSQANWVQPPTSCTEGPEVDSKVIGRAQGLYINSALDGMALYPRGSSREAHWKSREPIRLSSESASLELYLGLGSFGLPRDMASWRRSTWTWLT